MDLLPRDRASWLDLALASALATAGCYEILVRPLADDVVGGPTWLNLAAVLMGTLPLAWRRALPLWVSLILYGVLAGRALAAEPLEIYPTFLALLVATYTAASYAPLRDAVLSAATSVLALAVAVERGSGTDAAPDPVAATILLGTVWLVGRVVGVRNERAQALHAARDAHAAEAVVAERTRIAHEMHDSVTHHLAAIVMQAGGAVHVLTSDPERARASLAEIERTARRGLEEMRLSLGLLGEQDAVRTPAPDLTLVGDLVDRVRAGGLDVALQVRGDARAVDPAAGAAVYRVVQEALTNVMRHAAPCRARVCLRYLPDAIEVDVLDDGGGTAGTELGSGRGLVGMRERVTRLGGTLHAGDRTDAGAGFEVRARVPA